MLVLAPAAHAAGWPSWSGEPTGIFRTARYDGGEWIYTNGIQQAPGANSDGLHRTDYFKAADPHGDDPTHIPRDIYNAVTYDAFGSHRIAHNGDYQLPTDSAKFPVGTADLAELRLAVRGRDLYVRFLWNSFPRPDAQIATLTFGDGAAREWPRGARPARGAALRQVDAARRRGTRRRRQVHGSAGRSRERRAARQRRADLPDERVGPAVRGRRDVDLRRAPPGG